MSQPRYSTQRDLTASLPYAIPTGPHLLLAMCGHKTTRVGAEMRGQIVMRCPKCKEARK